MFLTEDNEHTMSIDTLGGRIVLAREEQDLSTSQLARRMGVQTETLRNWETGRKEPRSNRLMTLAGMLNVSPTWLLTGAGEGPVDSLTETDMMHIRDSVVRIREHLRNVSDELEQLQKRLESYESFQD
jgi:transcriptional regulator with XRE-family HTH domain